MGRWSFYITSFLTNPHSTKNKMEKTCKCADWKENAPILNNALLMSILHGMKGLKKSGSYCLWCGKKLQQWIEK